MSGTAGSDESDDFRPLNVSFYSADPARYFRTRLSVLLLAAARSEEMSRLLLEGVEYQGVVSSPGEWVEDTVEDERRHLEYLLIESEQLLHQASEALIRLFFAHEGMPVCPWLDLAGLTTFREFKERLYVLASESMSDERSLAVGRVFLATVGTGDQRRQEAQNAVTRLLRTLAKRLSEGAHAYNAVKHGLAVQGGEAGLSFSASDGSGAAFSASGTALTFLEWERAGSDRTWHMASQWIDVSQNMHFTNLAIVEIGALWAVARARYLGEFSEGISAISTEALDAVVSGQLRRTPTPLKKFRMSVAIEKDVWRQGN